eukprot:SAG11_NODE_1891_length_4106_cov_7.347891_1_plen_1128_part_10
MAQSAAPSAKISKEDHKKLVEKLHAWQTQREQKRKVVIKQQKKKHLKEPKKMEMDQIERVIHRLSSPPRRLEKDVLEENRRARGPEPGDQVGLDGMLRNGVHKQPQPQHKHWRPGGKKVLHTLRPPRRRLRSEVSTSTSFLERAEQDHARRQQKKAHNELNAHIVSSAGLTPEHTFKPRLKSSYNYRGSSTSRSGGESSELRTKSAPRGRVARVTTELKTTRAMGPVAPAHLPVAVKKAVIHCAWWVAHHGAEFERMIRTKNQSNPAWAFLIDDRLEEAEFYAQRLAFERKLVAERQRAANTGTRSPRSVREDRALERLMSPTRAHMPSRGTYSSGGNTLSSEWYKNLRGGNASGIRDKRWEQENNLMARRALRSKSAPRAEGRNARDRSRLYSPGRESKRPICSPQRERSKTPRDGRSSARSANGQRGASKHLNSPPRERGLRLRSPPIHKPALREGIEAHSPLASSWSCDWCREPAAARGSGPNGPNTLCSDCATAYQASWAKARERRGAPSLKKPSPPKPLGSPTPQKSYPRQAGGNGEVSKQSPPFAYPTFSPAAEIDRLQQENGHRAVSGLSPEAQALACKPPKPSAPKPSPKPQAPKPTPKPKSKPSATRSSSEALIMCEETAMLPQPLVESDGHNALAEVPEAMLLSMRQVDRKPKAAKSSPDHGRKVKKPSSQPRSEQKVGGGSQPRSEQKVGGGRRKKGKGQSNSGSKGAKLFKTWDEKAQQFERLADAVEHDSPTSSGLNEEAKAKARAKAKAAREAKANANSKTKAKEDQARASVDEARKEKADKAAEAAEAKAKADEDAKAQAKSKAAAQRRAIVDRLLHQIDESIGCNDKEKVAAIITQAKPLRSKRLAGPLESLQQYMASLVEEETKHAEEALLAARQKAETNARAGAPAEAMAENAALEGPNEWQSQAEAEAHAHQEAVGRAAVEVKSHAKVDAVAHNELEEAEEADRVAAAKAEIEAKETTALNLAHNEWEAAAKAEAQARVRTEKGAQDKDHVGAVQEFDPFAALEAVLESGGNLDDLCEDSKSDSEPHQEPKPEPRADLGRAQNNEPEETDEDGDGNGDGDGDDVMPDAVDSGAPSAIMPQAQGGGSRRRFSIALSKGALDGAMESGGLE